MMKYLNKLLQKNKYFDEDIIQLSTTNIDVNLTPITNSRTILDYIVNIIQTKAFKESKKPITQSCIVELTNYFGKNNAIFRGSEYVYKVWILSFADTKFEIFTANKYGTQIVVDLTLEQIQSGKYDKLLKEFINKFYNIIN